VFYDEIVVVFGDGTLDVGTVFTGSFDWHHYIVTYSKAEKRVSRLDNQVHFGPLSFKCRNERKFNLMQYFLCRFGYLLILAKTRRSNMTLQLMAIGRKD
jgi:hypothetical protein